MILKPNIIQIFKVYIYILFAFMWHKTCNKRQMKISVSSRSPKFENFNVSVGHLSPNSKANFDEIWHKELVKKYKLDTFTFTIEESVVKFRKICLIYRLKILLPLPPIGLYLKSGIPECISVFSYFCVLVLCTGLKTKQRDLF